MIQYGIVKKIQPAVHSAYWTQRNLNPYIQMEFGLDSDPEYLKGWNNYSDKKYGNSKLRQGFKGVFEE
jgi:hypothetical protein